MVESNVSKLHFGPALDAMLSPRDLVVLNEDTRYGKKVTVKFNELSGEPEEMSTSAVGEFSIPQGSIAEGSWRGILARNARIQRNRQLYNIFAPPAIEGGIKFLAGLADLFTLGFLSFSDRTEDVKKTANEFADIYGDKWFDTKVSYLAYGIPPAPKQRQKVTIERAGSMPLYRHNVCRVYRVGFDDPATEEAYCRQQEKNDYRSGFRTSGVGRYLRDRDLELASLD